MARIRPSLFVKYIPLNVLPTINKKEIKTKPVKYRKEKKEKAADMYNSIAWKKLRNTFISLHPVCQCCLEHNRVTPAEEAHHKVPFLRGETEEEQWKLFLDEKNLLAVCRICHLALHIKDREYNLGSLDSLTDTEWRYAHGVQEKYD